MSNIGNYYFLKYMERWHQSINGGHLWVIRLWVVFSAFCFLCISNFQQWTSVTFYNNFVLRMKELEYLVILGSRGAWCGWSCTCDFWRCGVYFSSPRALEEGMRVEADLQLYHTDHCWTTRPEQRRRNSWGLVQVSVAFGWLEVIMIKNKVS